MVCQEDPTRKDSEVLLGVRWYVIITSRWKDHRSRGTKDAVGHLGISCYFCSLRCEFGRGLGAGQDYTPGYTCSAMYFCGFWLVIESAGGSVSSSVELRNTTWPTYFIQGFCQTPNEVSGETVSKVIKCQTEDIIILKAFILIKYRLIFDSF